MPLDLTPKPIKLTVADEYKRFFYRKWNTHLLWGIVPALIVLPLFILVIIAEGFKHRIFEFWGHLAIFPVAGITWFYWLRKPFSYQINKHGIGVIEISKSTWSWHLISWKDSIILSVSDSTWQDLPALTIRVGETIDSTITYHSDWQMVYRSEDVHKLRDQVIPAIEYYREKHGHNEWIKSHGWETYQKPAALTADA